MESTLKQRSDKMKAAFNTKLQESKALQKTALEEEYKTILEQDKQIWLAEHASATRSIAPTNEGQGAVGTNQATPATPTGTSVNTADLMNMSDTQMRELLTSNATAKSIIQANIRKKLEIEIQKLKEDYEKATAQKLGDAAKKAEDAKAQAVVLEGKKSALKLNMTDNKLRTAIVKLEVVEIAAKETPERPVGEVWEIAKNAKPPPAPAPALSIQASVASREPTKPTVKAEANGSNIPHPQTNNVAPQASTTTSSIPQGPSKPASANQAPNGTSSLPVSKLPAVSCLLPFLPRANQYSSHLRNQRTTVSQIFQEVELTFVVVGNHTKHHGGGWLPEVEGVVGSVVEHL
jgi:nucleoprotein TPR